MCGPDAFETVVENIRALKAGGVDVSLNLSITPWNREDLQKIRDISRELGVPVRASSYMYPPARLAGRKEARLSAEDAARCRVQWELLDLPEAEFLWRAEQMKALSAAEPRECAIDPDAGVGCRAGSTSFWLTWDGRMLPCGMMPFPETHPLETGFERAWQELRAATGEIRTPVACQSCEKREVCAVCAAMRAAETGSFDGVPEYVCRMTEATVGEYWKEYRNRKGGES